MIDTLEELFRKMAREHECRVTGIVCDVRIKPPGCNQKSDAIQARLDHVQGYSVEIFVPYKIVNNEVRYGETFAHKGNGAIFRYYKLQ